MSIAEILAALGVGESLISTGVNLFNELIADGSTTTTAEQAAALNAAVAQTQADQTAFENGSGPTPPAP